MSMMGKNQLPGTRWSWPQSCATIGFVIGAYLGWRLSSSNLKIRLNHAVGHMAIGSLFIGLCSAIPGYLVGRLVSLVAGANRHGKPASRHSAFDEL
jgi:hypothetical protein